VDRFDYLPISSIKSFDYLGYRDSPDMATQALSRAPPVPVPTDKPRTLQHDTSAHHPGYHPVKRSGQQTPLYIPPNEFRMKLLKRILSVDGTIDNKALQKLQKTSTDKTLQANIVFQNGDVGTLISFDRYTDNNEEDNESTTPEQTLPALPVEPERTTVNPNGEKKERPLKLPPIMLPPIHTLNPRPLLYRDFSGPVELPGPLTNDDWDELEDCRYLRPSRKQFKEVRVTERSFLQ